MREYQAIDIERRNDAINIDTEREEDRRDPCFFFSRERGHVTARYTLTR